MPRVLVLVLVLWAAAATVVLADAPPICRSPNDLTEGCLGTAYDPAPMRSDGFGEPEGVRLVAQYERAIRSLNSVRGALPAWGDALFVGLLTEVIRLAVAAVGDHPLVGLLLDIMQWTGDDGQPIDAIVVRACELLLGVPRTLCVQLAG